MGIAVEFCPDLALRSFGTVGRKSEECLPKEIVKGKVFNFLKEGQRNYWMLGELPLRETKGNSILSRPLASVKFLEVIHFVDEGKIWTKGRYEIIEVYDIKDKAVHFDGLEKIK